MNRFSSLLGLLAVAAILAFVAPVTEAQTFKSANGPYGHPVYSIAFNSTGKLFVGAHEYVWKLDAGAWSKIQLLPSPLYTNPQAGSSRPLLHNGSGTMWEVDHVYVNDKKIWRSTNDGATWSSVTTIGLTPPQIYTLYLGESGTIFAGGFLLQKAMLEGCGNLPTTASTGRCSDRRPLLASMFLVFIAFCSNRAFSSQGPRTASTNQQMLGQRGLNRTVDSQARMRLDSQRARARSLLGRRMTSSVRLITVLTGRNLV